METKKHPHKLQASFREIKESAAKYERQKLTEKQQKLHTHFLSGKKKPNNKYYISND